MNKTDDSKFFDVLRLKDLGDAIFAFAMTFLIVTIDIPKVAPELLREQILRISPDILTYVISFFLLAIFWMTNHIQMKEVKRADSRLIWIGMLLFLLIVFIPLTTDLYTFYDTSRLTMLLFNINILLIGLVFMLQWHHLVANSLHHDQFTEEEIRVRYRVSFSLILVAFLSIGLGWFFPVWAPVVYLLLGAYRVQLRKRMVKERKN